jgi:hypothetical protein
MNKYPQVRKRGVDAVHGSCPQTVYIMNQFKIKILFTLAFNISLHLRSTPNFEKLMSPCPVFKTGLNQSFFILGQQTDCASNMPVIQREAVANKPQLQKQV